MYYNNNYQQVPPMNMMYGTSYQQSIQPPKFTQGISEEQANLLRQNHEQFTLNIDPVEILKCRCTHKNIKTHAYELETLDDNSVQCRICGERFNIITEDGEPITQAVQRVIDILQTDKTFYLDMPEKYATEYFNMIAWLKKLPQLHSLSLSNFAKYEDAGLFRSAYAPQQQGAVQFYNSYINGGVVPNQYANPMMSQTPYMGQPMMGQQSMQPMQGYNPNMMPNTGMMPTAEYNPFTSNGTQYGMIPQQQPMMGQQYNGYNNPNIPTGQPMVVPQQPVQTQQPVAQQTTTVNPTATPTQPVQTTTTTVGNETQQSSIFNA